MVGKFVANVNEHSTHSNVSHGCFGTSVHSISHQEEAANCYKGQWTGRWKLRFAVNSGGPYTSVLGPVFSRIFILGFGSLFSAFPFLSNCFIDLFHHY